jgi:GH18 family chitinase
MTYDMYGPWSEYTGQNSPLWASSVESEWEKDNLNMDAAIRQWRDAGASAGKLIAGIAFYGHSFTLKDSNNNGLHAPIKGAGKGGPIIGEEGSWSYLEVICRTHLKKDLKAKNVGSFARTGIPGVARGMLSKRCRFVLVETNGWV